MVVEQAFGVVRWPIRFWLRMVATEPSGSSATGRSSEFRPSATSSDVETGRCCERYGARGTLERTFGCARVARFDAVGAKRASAREAHATQTFGSAT